MLETIVIQVTTQCPFNCSQCYMEKGTQEMDFNNAKSIVNWALKNNVQMVQFTGGEPMIYSHLEQLVKYCHWNGLLTTVATSGYGCSSSKIQGLEKAGLNAICVSLNGFLKKTDVLTRTTFDYAVQALNLLKDSSICSFINCVITRDNFAELKAISSFAKEKKVEKIILLRPFGNHFSEVMLLREDLTKLKILCDKENDLLQVENCYLEYWSEVYGQDILCEDAAKTSVFFRADGKVQPCSKCFGYYSEDADDLIKNFSFKGECLFN